ELPLGATRTVNAVLIEGDPLTLVDTGVRTPESLAALARAFVELGRRVEELEQIVITHPHHDHFGAAAVLADRSRARVIGHAAAAGCSTSSTRWRASASSRSRSPTPVMVP